MDDTGQWVFICMDGFDGCRRVLLSQNEARQIGFEGIYEKVLSLPLTSAATSDCGVSVLFASRKQNLSEVFPYNGAIAIF